MKKLTHAFTLSSVFTLKYFHERLPSTRIDERASSVPFRMKLLVLLMRRCTSCIDVAVFVQGALVIEGFSRTFFVVVVVFY